VSFGKVKGEPGYDIRGDFDCIDIVNIADFDLLSINFGKFCQIEVPGS
jgi:hypothetical protein